MYSYMLYSRAANIHVAHAVMSGRRSCLGQLLAQQEIYLFLAALVQNFVIKPPEGADEVVCDENVAVAVSPEHYTVRLIPRSYE